VAFLVSLTAVRRGGSRVLSYLALAISSMLLLFLLVVLSIAFLFF